MSIPGRESSDSRTYQFNGSHVVISGSIRAFEAEIIIAVAHHNQAAMLSGCLKSISAQRDVPVPAVVLVLDDESTDGWRGKLGGLSPAVDLAIAQGRCGSAALARNTLLDLADVAFPNARWVARLDADDRFASPDSLSAAVRLGISSGARFVLGGNGLMAHGVRLERTNPAMPDLLRADYVLSRLVGMANGDADAELPSCNLMLATHAGWRYPLQTSGEDHWLVAELLLRHPRFGAILLDPLYADYDLNGALTARNHRRARFLSARQSLLSTGLGWLGKGAVKP